MDTDKVVCWIAAVAVATVVLVGQPTVAGTIHFVDDDATGGNEGSSWINAFADLSEPRVFLAEELRTCPSCEHAVRFTTNDPGKESMQCPICKNPCSRLRLNVLKLIDLTDISSGGPKIILTSRRG